MKKIHLILIMVLLLTLTGCGKNQSLYDSVYNVNDNDLSQEDYTLQAEGVYYNSFVFESKEEVTSWIEENSNWGSYLLIEEINTYNEAFYDENILVIVYVTWRAYSEDFFIKNQEFVDNTLSIEIQYHVPWYAFGDSYSNLYGLIVELPKAETNDISVEVTYVDR